MMITAHIAGAALVIAAAGYAIRAHLLGGSSPGWPAAPWWVRAMLYLAGAVCGGQGAMMAAYASEPVGPGVMMVCIVVGASSFTGALNLARQRGRGTEHRPKGPTNGHLQPAEAAFARAPAAEPRSFRPNA